MSAVDGNSSTGPVDDGFAVVTRKKKSRKNQKYVVKPKTLDDHLQQLSGFKDELTSSAVFAEIKEGFRLRQTGLNSGSLVQEVEKSESTDSENEPQTTFGLRAIRCLALGSPTESSIAMYQLALLQLIIDMLNISAESVSLYDPVFTSADLELFESMNYSVSEAYNSATTLPDEGKNDTQENSKQLAGEKSDGILVYMIHSPPSLTESIIASQDSKYKVFIGNVLTNYSDHLLQADLDKKYPNISSAISSCDQFNKKSLEEHLNKQKETTDLSTDLEQLSLENNAKSPKESSSSKDQKDWFIYEILEKLSKDSPWSTAFNDTAIYWRQ